MSDLTNQWKRLKLKLNEYHHIYACLLLLLELVFVLLFLEFPLYVTLIILMIVFWFLINPYYQKLKQEKETRYKEWLDELRFLLTLEDKYETFKSLNQFVLKPAAKEINKLTPIEIKLNYKRKGRSAYTIEFYIIGNGKYVHPSQGMSPFPLDKKSKAKKKVKKRAPFDMEQFMKRYSRIYLDLIKDVQRQFPQIPMDNQASQHALRNACKTWYINNA